MKLRFETLFLLGWAAFVFVWATSVVMNGGFNYGRSGSTYITSASHPKLYWAMVGLAIVSGVVVIAVAVHDIRNPKK